MRMPVPPASTYVAIERTPSESAASGMIFIGFAVGAAAQGSAARRSPLDTTSTVHFHARPRDHRRVIGSEEHRRVGQILGLVESAQRHGGDVLAQAFLVDLHLVPEGGEHR